MEAKDANSILNADLEELERKIKLIGTSDREKFREFMDRLKAIQNSTIGMSKSDFDSAKFTVINDLTKLQFDFNSYMDGTETNDTMTKQVSGKSKIKKHKIGLYTSIVEDLKKLDEIDIEKLRTLREKWDEEKQDDYLDYLPIEQSIVEEAISEAFLEYQIKHVQKHGNLPQEKLQEFTTTEEYKASIKDKLLDLANSDNIDAKTRLDIEKYLMEDNLETLLKQENIWKILTQKDRIFTEKSIDKVLAEKDAAAKNPENLPMVIPDKKSKHQYMYCTIKKKGLFGKEKEKSVKVKIKHGFTNIPDRYRDKVVSIAIPEGIEKITSYSFLDCINLERVSIPSTVTVIDTEAFKGCMSLIDVELPDNLTKIESYAFSNCENLENINLHPNITSIGDYCFENTAIRELDFTKGEPDIPESCLGIGIGAFRECRNLEKVKLSQRTTYLADKLFENCSNLKEVGFARNLRVIGQAVFRNCSLLNEMMDIPDSVTEIGGYTFNGCPNLNKFKMPTFLKYMSGVAFDSDKKFDKFVLPKQLMNVEILERLRINEDTIFDVPEDAKGYLYEKLGISAGEKIKYTDLKFKLAEKNAQEKVMEVERIPTTKMRRVGKNYRMVTQYEDPVIEITSVTSQDNHEGHDELDI